MRSADSAVLASIRHLSARLRAQSGRPLSVLIVDDEAPVRRFVERALHEAGYDTTTAADGASAIEAAKKRSIDLLLTDVKMPQMTGDELARRLRRTEPRLKGLSLTGFSDQLFRDKTTLRQDEAFLENRAACRGCSKRCPSSPRDS